MVAEVIPVRWQKGLTDRRGTRQQGNSSALSGNDRVIPVDNSLGRALGKEGVCEVQAQFPQILHRGAIVSWRRLVTPLGQQPNVKVTWKRERRAGREKGGAPQRRSLCGHVRDIPGQTGVRRG